MSKGVLLLSGLMLAAPAFGQATSPEVQLADLREDVQGLSQRVSDLTLRVEQLEAANARLADQAKSAEQGRVTVVELNEAVAALNQTLQSTVAASKDETLRQVAAQMEKLARQTNAAIESLSRSPVAHAPGQGSFSDDFPKEGVNYTVQRGETIAAIAKKTGAKISDIINANKITDPSRIQAGQALFIPGGK